MAKRVVRRNLIKELRLGRGWTQGELGARIDVLKETIYRIEAGRQRITETQAKDLARVFGISIDELYETPIAMALAEEAVPFDPEPGSFNSHIQLEKEHQSWYRIARSHLDAIGFSDGAEVIIDISKDALDNLRIGDAVIANKYDDKNWQKAETIVRQFIPPALLITNSFIKNLPSLRLDADNVCILGLIVYPRRLVMTARPTIR